MANLTTIPKELLSRILSFLLLSEIVLFTRVCKAFQQTCERLLYARIELKASLEACDRRTDLERYKACQLLHRSLERRREFPFLVGTLVMEARSPTLFTELSPVISFPTLRTLILHFAHMTGPTLYNLLSTTPNLQNFEFNSECDAEPHNRFQSNFFDCSELASALELVSRTLIRLKLSIDFSTTAALETENGGSFEDGDAWGIKESLGQTLHSFPHLTSVDMPWAVLLGWSAEGGARLADRLPPELHALVLAHDLGYFYNYAWNDKVCIERILEYLGDETRPARLESIGFRFSDEDKVALDWNAWGRVRERYMVIGCQFWLA